MATTQRGRRTSLTSSKKTAWLTVGNFKIPTSLVIEKNHVWIYKLPNISRNDTGLSRLIKFSRTFSNVLVGAALLEIKVSSVCQ